MSEHKFLVSDIGGTNIRLAWFADNPRNRLDEVTYKTDPQTNRPYEILPAIKNYCKKVNQKFSAACLGMAGRLEDDCIQITNRPDCVYRRDVASALGLDMDKVMLINDMPPHLAGVDLLLGSEIVEIHSGKFDAVGSRALLMPGTGVGIGGALSVPGLPHQPFASEGGHIDFAPRDQQQAQLMQFLTPFAAVTPHRHVSNEFVFAGEGLRRIYAFLENPGRKNLDGCPTSENITGAMTSADLPADNLSRRTVELFLTILGAAAGNLALMFTATGGIYLGGGICLSLSRYFSTPIFLNAFLESGPLTHRDFIQEIPIRLIDYKDSGLLGAGALAKSLLTS